MVSRPLSLMVGVLTVLSFSDCFAQTQLSSFMELPELQTPSQELESLKNTFSEVGAMNACFDVDPPDFDRLSALATKWINDPKQPPMLRAVAYFNRGLAKFSQNRRVESLADLEASVKVQPLGTDSLHAARAALFTKLGKYEKAIVECDHALKLRPDAGDYCERAIALHLLGRNDQALVDLERSIKLNPTARALDWRARVHWDNANEAVRLDPDDLIKKKSRLHCDIICFKNDPAPAFRRKLIETGIADITALLDAGDSKKVDILFKRGCFYWHAEEYAKALDDFDAMVKELGDKAPMPRLRRAFTQLRLAAKETSDANRKERLEKALEDAETVIRSDDKRGEAFFCRSKVHEALDETEKAQEDRRQAELLGFRGDENALFVFER